MKRAVLYLRVSTTEQTTANQERELREVASRMGCEITHVYKDHGISGAKGREKRPAFDRMCRDAAQRKFDVVMAWSVDRLGRSLQDLVGFLSELHALRLTYSCISRASTRRHPPARRMFQMMGVFAEFERSMIQERVRAGLKRAKAREKAWQASDSVRAGGPHPCGPSDGSIRTLRRSSASRPRLCSASLALSDASAAAA